MKATEGRRRRETDATAEAGALAEALDYLTLALVHAAAYIAERRFTFARYRAEWHASRDRVLDRAAPDVTGHPMSLAQTWITSMDQLTPAGRTLLEEAESLMRRMAVIFLTFERATGHKHPYGDADIRNYENLLAELGRDPAAIRAALADARREAGMPVSDP